VFQSLSYFNAKKKLTPTSIPPPACCSAFPDFGSAAWQPIVPDSLPAQHSAGSQQQALFFFPALVKIYNFSPLTKITNDARNR
jgi:hypothetical protein